MATDGSSQANVDTLSRDLALLGVQPGRAVTSSLLKGQWDGIVCRMGVNQRREHKAAYDRSAEIKLVAFLAVHGSHHVLGCSKNYKFIWVFQMSRLKAIFPCKPYFEYNANTVT